MKDWGGLKCHKEGLGVTGRRNLPCHSSRWSSQNSRESGPTQAARVDPAGIAELLSAVLGRSPAGAKLWPYSDGILRRRFRKILCRLSLASLRPGGATCMLAQTENAELVRRRGRRLSGRVMEIYLQEISVATYVPQLPAQKVSLMCTGRAVESFLYKLQQQILRLKMV